MSHRVEIAPAASRQIRGLEKPAQAKILRVFHMLADNPRPPSCKKLAGEESLCRVRTGDYRIIYELRDASLLVLVVKVRHRRDIYRRHG